jgi:hypothetical protein
MSELDKTAVSESSAYWKVQKVKYSELQQVTSSQALISDLRLWIVWQLTLVTQLHTQHIWDIGW